jgi:hypothetical protein
MKSAGKPGRGNIAALLATVLLLAGLQVENNFQIFLQLNNLLTGEPGKLFNEPFIVNCPGLINQYITQL